MARIGSLQTFRWLDCYYASTSYQKQVCVLCSLICNFNSLKAHSSTAGTVAAWSLVQAAKPACQRACTCWELMHVDLCPTEAVTAHNIQRPLVSSVYGCMVGIWRSEKHTLHCPAKLCELSASGCKRLFVSSDYLFCFNKDFPSGYWVCLTVLIPAEGTSARIAT